MRFAGRTYIADTKPQRQAGRLFRMLRRFKDVPHVLYRQRENVF